MEKHCSRRAFLKTGSLARAAASVSGVLGAVAARAIAPARSRVFCTGDITPEGLRQLSYMKELDMGNDRYEPVTL
jgi:hypothetical protein